MCTLTSRSVLGMNNIYTLKPAILDSLFTLKMGSDRLSMQVTKLTLKIISINGFVSSYWDYPFPCILLKSIVIFWFEKKSLSYAFFNKRV